MRHLYPPIDPYGRGMLQVSDLHMIYFEESGNPEGIPVIVLHGGPGGGSQPSYRQYFDPRVWRIVQLDQRGCGHSTPHAELRENTTWRLIEDIEVLRQHLDIEQWFGFGGSWGSTLALAYAQTHPDRCLGLVLRGIFMLRQQEIHWFYQEGASYLFPDAWEAYLKPIPLGERDNLVAAYHKRLTSPDPKICREAARAWAMWEASTSKLLPDPNLMQAFGEEHFATAFARIECHYFINQGFFETDDQLLRNVHRIRHLPAVIVQGRYDVVCPMRSAWDLHRAWPEAELVIVGDAGHSMSEPGIKSALIEATERFSGWGAP
ncbi:MAG: prolyl aminopeptidase [Synechococcales cyanobacterium RU_4_20]|nr:prolyl aminopeptidase [Synechococcales cyanobacterium RU_4_20]NJR68314.1 prolyl aminopeptidase [Synechococcales cyanobacterium CRU_2_2]